jgi:7-cyano-7-deazaguanine reductase
MSKRTPTNGASALGATPPTQTNGTTPISTTAQTDTQGRVPGVYGREEIAQNHLEPWPNPRPTRDYVIHFELPEFTCVCPRSGFPDFATIVIDYVPDASVVELKSLKLYINGYRDRAISHEGATNDILDDLIAALAPRWMRVVAEFNARGNVKTTVTAEHATPSYAGPRPAYQRPTYTGI